MLCIVIALVVVAAATATINYNTKTVIIVFDPRHLFATGYRQIMTRDVRKTEIRFRFGLKKLEPSKNLTSVQTVL